MTTNTEWLKPCPTCEMHSSVILKREYHESGDYFVLCTMQSGCGMSSGFFDQKEECVAAWNRRPTAQASEAIRQEAFEQCAKLVEAWPLDARNMEIAERYAKHGLSNSVASVLRAEVTSAIRNLKKVNRGLS